MIFAPAKQLEECQWLSLLLTWGSMAIVVYIFFPIRNAGIGPFWHRLSWATQGSGETSAFNCACRQPHHDPSQVCRFMGTIKRLEPWKVPTYWISGWWYVLFLNSSKLEVLPVTFSNSQGLGFPTWNQTSFLFSKPFLLDISLLCSICPSIYSFRPAGGFWLTKKPPVPTCHF